MSGNRFEISSKLKNMKFMQRGSEKEDKNTPRPTEADTPNPTPDMMLASTPAATATPSSATPGSQKSNPSSSKFSGKLMQMKFMQRAAERQKLEEGVQQKDDKLKEMQWTVKNAATKCVVIAERDPLPGAACGRMSFGSFNTATEQLQKEQDALAAGLPLPKKDAEVSDADMARSLGKRKSQQEEGAPKSLRMQKRQKR